MAAKTFLLVVAICSAASAFAEFRTVPPRYQSSYPPGGVWHDIDCRCKGLPEFRCNNFHGYIHETIHKLNNEIDNRGTNYGFYMLNGEAWFCRRPPITVADVMRAVPYSVRGNLWHQYFEVVAARQQADCLYALDELTAFIGGTFAATEAGAAQDAQFSLACALEFWNYALVTQETCRRAGFQQQAELDIVMRHWFAQLNQLIAEHQRRGWPRIAVPKSLGFAAFTFRRRG